MKFDNPEKLITLFYVSGGPHDLTPQWFSSIRNVKVICLGRWELKGRGEHIQRFQISTPVRIGDKYFREWTSKEAIKYLQGLKYLKNLKFLSLEGFSGVREFPFAARKLKNLIVLNLKDCSLLGTLPNGIGSLKDLTHLDISGCELLQFMPKGLKQLTALKVLKGFVTGEGRLGCKLDDLLGLKKLKKLSVIIREGTPDEHLLALKRFPSLKILRIGWEGNVGLDRSMQWLPPDLEKLELWGIPTETIHIQVMPEKLKKLYITDADLSLLYLGPADLRILRLQNLPDLWIDLTDIIDKFPQLIYCKIVGSSKIEEFADRTMKEKGFHKLDESSPTVWVKRVLDFENLKLKQDLGFKWSFLPLN